MISRFLLFSLIVCGATSATAQAMRQVELHSSIDGVEPFKGITFWTENDKAHRWTGSYALEFAYCLPCDVVTGKDGGVVQYDWSCFDALLDDIKSRGHKAVIRFRYEYPGEKTHGVKGATAVPQYIKDLPDYNETYKSNPGGDGPTYYADWSNQELMWFTKQFYVDLAARYDSDPRLAYIQVGFGHWSEYHIYDGSDDPYIYGVNFPTKEYQREFLNHMDTNTFAATPWSISIDAGEEHAPAAEAQMQELHFGLFDDSFMHQNHEIGSKDGYNEELWILLNGLDERWKHAPCGGEVSYYKSKDQKEFLRPGTGIYGISYEQAASKYHITYMIGNDCTSGSFATAGRVMEASQNSGYRFVVESYAVSDTEARVEVRNAGIAPCYFDVYPTVEGVRSATSLKGLLPGESRVCTVTGLNLAAIETPALTITGDKLYPGETVPYAADLTGSRDEDSGIQGVEYVRTGNESPAFNILGQKAGAGYKGMIIVNGRKILKK